MRVLGVTVLGSRAAAWPSRPSAFPRSTIPKRSEWTGRGLRSFPVQWWLGEGGAGKGNCRKRSRAAAVVGSLIATSSRAALGVQSRPKRVMHAHIGVDDSELAAFCRKNHIRKLAFFGSVLRSDFRSDSDIDVLIEFEPGHVPGLTFFALQDGLGRMLGRRVDLHTPASLSTYFRDQVLREAEPVYVAA